MEHIKLNAFTIHAGESIFCSQCNAAIALKNERLYRSGYWKQYDLIFCNATCVRTWDAREEK